MLLVTPLLKHAAYPALSRSGYFRSWRTCQTTPLTVLAYHGVFPSGYIPRSHLLDGNLISAKCLHQQLNLLKRHYNVVEPEEFLGFLDGAVQLPPRAVLLTCDDGLANVVSDMLPVLQDLSVKCLFFITGASFTENPGMLWHEELWLLFAAAPPGRLNFKHSAAFISEIPGDQHKRHSAWWELVRQLSRADVAVRKNFLQELSFAANLPEDWKMELLQNPVQRNRFRLLTKSEVGVLTRAGMTVGTHTMTHPVLSECPQGIAEEEISKPLILARNKLNASLWSLAYPYGTPETVSSREVVLAEAAGYHCGFMNTGGLIPPSINKFVIPRVHITAALNLGEFEAYASGFHQHLQARLSRSTSPRYARPVLSES